MAKLAKDVDHVRDIVAAMLVDVKLDAINLNMCNRRVRDDRVLYDMFLLAQSVSGAGITCGDEILAEAPRVGKEECVIFMDLVDKLVPLNMAYLYSLIIHIIKN
jgi:hypothetical protein